MEGQPVKPIYVRVTEKFRAAKTVADLDRAASEHAADFERLRNSASEFDVGNYHAMREAYKYYRRLILAPIS